MLWDQSVGGKVAGALELDARVATAPKIVALSCLLIHFDLPLKMNVCVRVAKLGQRQ